MNRQQINERIASTAGVDVVNTERVLVGLEKVVMEELEAAKGNKFARIILLYQNWKGK